MDVIWWQCGAGWSVLSRMRRRVKREGSRRRRERRYVEAVDLVRVLWKWSRPATRVLLLLDTFASNPQVQG